MRIADVLRTKGPGVHTVRSGAPVSELVALLRQHNVGALVVVDGDAVAGIVSERDVVRRLAGDGPALLDAPVAEIMSAAVTTCSPDDTVDEVMGVITERRFRHLPVLVDGKLGGIVSIGDMVSAKMRDLERERAQLESYISGG